MAAMLAHRAPENIFESRIETVPEAPNRSCATSRLAARMTTSMVQHQLMP
jgi:hypothetical protein